MTHGANDGQKTMGVITALLIAGGFINSEEFVVPLWVMLSAAVAIGLGTFFGGWRIVKTMAFRLTDLNHIKDFVQKQEAWMLTEHGMAWNTS